MTPSNLNISFQRYIFTILLLFAGAANAQTVQNGTPVMYNFTHKDDKNITQTWSIAQDGRGVMYFGTSSGLLEYDSHTWKNYKMPNSSVIRATKIINGKLFVGAFEEFGYFMANKRGALQYISLSDSVKEKLNNYGDVWKIIQMGDDVFFQCRKAVCVYSKGKTESLFIGDIITAAMVNNHFYIIEKNAGLLEFDGKKFIASPLSHDVSKIDAWFMLPWNTDTMLIASASKGLYFYNRHEMVAWQAKVNQLFAKHQLYSGTLLQNGNYALGTIQDGVYIIDKKGTVIQHLNKSRGLQNNSILSIFQDNTGNLWLGNDEGIDLLELNTPVTRYNENWNIFGSIYSTVVYNNKLYVGTSRGVYFKNMITDTKADNIDNTFTFIEKTKGQVWNLSVIDNRLYCGHNVGTFSVDKQNVELISTVAGAWRFIQLKQFADYVIQGTYSGLVVFKKTSNGLVYQNKIAGFDESARIMEEDQDGYLWVAHPYKGVYKILISPDMQQVAKITFYEATNDFLSNVYVFKINDKLVFTSKQGFYKYIKEKDTFVPDTALQAVINVNEQPELMFQDQKQNIWLGLPTRYSFWQRTSNHRYINNDTISNKIGNNLIGGFQHISALDSSTLFFSTGNEVVQFSRLNSVSYSKPYYCLIRKVVCTLPIDSVLFDGTFSDTNGNYTTMQSSGMVPVLKYEMNALRFSYAASFYEDNDKNRYQFKLQGFDKEWSQWTTFTSKEYTNLPAGKYTFKVKTMNSYGFVSHEAQYTFFIQRPWYRSIGAYIVYTLLIILFIGAMAYTGKLILKKQKQKLEQEKTEALRRTEEMYLKQKLEAEKLIVELENDKLQAEIEKTNLALEHKNSEMIRKNAELASFAIHVSHKNKILTDISNELKAIYPKLDEATQRDIRKLIKDINADIEMDNDWDRFVVSFEQVHENFFKKLTATYPDLTATDLKLCAYIRMKLSTKEIATLLNNSLRGVEKARYRLRKKLALQPEVNLIEFISAI